LRDAETERGERKRERQSDREREGGDKERERREAA
jgi:hypothetical protein